MMFACGVQVAVVCLATFLAARSVVTAAHDGHNFGLSSSTEHYLPGALQSLADRLGSLQYLQDHEFYKVAVNSTSGGSLWFDPLKILKWIEAYLTNTNVTQGKSCFVDFLMFLQALVGNDTDLWALKMVDASGKIGSGILQGNIRWPGSFSLCGSIKQESRIIPDKTTGEPFRAQYCWTEFVLQPDAKKTMPNMSYTPPLELAICVPDSCSAKEIYTLLNKTQAFLHPITKFLKLGAVACIPQERNPWGDPKFVGALIVALIFLTLLLVGTAYDICLSFYSVPRKYKRMRDSSSVSVNSSEKEIGQGDDTKPDSSANETSVTPENDQYSPVEYKQPASGFIFGKILLAFSVYTNGPKIFNLQPSKETLAPLNGIRFFSMTWVILGHTYLFSSMLTDNILVVLDVMKTTMFQLVAQGTMSVDSFFVLSGLLVTYLYLKEHKRSNGNISWVKFYVHRYWRLTPPYILVMFVVSDGLSKYWSNGPFWPQDGFEGDRCTKSWWWNMLYINNFQSARDMCMGHTWYLSNDMQFYIISPLILIPLTRFFPLAAALGGFFIVANWIATGFLAAHYNIGAGLDLRKMAPGTDAYYTMFDTIYDKPYCRIAPYIVGMACGWLLFKTNCKVRMSRVWVILGWTAAAVCNLSVIFGLTDNFPGVQVSALYHALSRTAWSLGLAWVIFACCTGYGGIVNHILSWPAWNPLSRITYCAYLWHLALLSAIMDSSDVMGHFSHTTMIYRYLANVIVTYIGALFLSLAFESPMLAIERLILRKET